MAILAWLRKVQHALHECADSIRRAEERKGNQQMPRDGDPLKVQAVVSFDQKTVANETAQEKRNYATQRSIKNATWWAFGAVAAYAVVTTFMWCAMIEQNKIASKAMRQSTESFRLDERAWVELEPIKPTFLAPANAKQSAAFTCNIYPKNVGKTIARDVVVKAQDLGAAEGMGDSAEQMRNTQDKFLVNEFKENGTENTIIVQNNPIPKALAPNAVSQVPFRLTCQAPQVFPSGHQFMHYMVGRIDYCDQFKIKHWLKFCFYVVNARGEIWACKEGNDEDRNDETQTPESACGKAN